MVHKLAGIALKWFHFKRGTKCKNLMTFAPTQVQSQNLRNWGPSSSPGEKSCRSGSGWGASTWRSRCEPLDKLRLQPQHWVFLLAVPTPPKTSSGHAAHLVMLWKRKLYLWPLKTLHWSRSLKKYEVTILS